MGKGTPAPILYHGEPNGPSLSVLAALEECGLDIECRLIDLLAGERHRIPGIAEPLALDYSVEGEGPVLVVEGEAMTDAVFLARYFDETAGGCRLQPSDPYAHWQMMMWCRQVTERLAPAVAYLGALAHAHQRLTRMDAAAFERTAAAIVSDDLRRRWQDLRDDVVDAAKVADSKAKVAEFVHRVEGQLADGREFLVGRFSIADLESFAWLRPAAVLEEQAFAGKDHCNAWLARLDERPSVRAALGRATGNAAHAFAPGPEINRWG